MPEIKLVSLLTFQFILKLKSRLNCLNLFSIWDLCVHVNTSERFHNRVYCQSMSWRRKQMAEVVFSRLSVSEPIA